MLFEFLILLLVQSLKAKLTFTSTKETKDIYWLNLIKEHLNFLLIYMFLLMKMSLFMLREMEKFMLLDIVNPMKMLKLLDNNKLQNKILKIQKKKIQKMKNKLRKICKKKMMKMLMLIKIQKNQKMRILMMKI